jgi:hypothetical protein
VEWSHSIIGADLRNENEHVTLLYVGVGGVAFESTWVQSTTHITTVIVGRNANRAEALLGKSDPECYHS